VPYMTPLQAYDMDGRVAKLCQHWMMRRVNVLYMTPVWACGMVGYVAKFCCTGL
jgi:hypothetical protein